MVGRRGPGTLECCAGLKVQVAHLGDSHLAEVLASEAKKFWGKGLLVVTQLPLDRGVIASDPGAWDSDPRWREAVGPMGTDG